MKAWQLEKLGGKLSLNDIAIPEVRPGSVLVKMQSAALMSYQKAYVKGELSYYHTPKQSFTLGANGVGTIAAVGKDVWHLKAGQRVIISSFLTAGEQVPEPGQMLLGVTGLGPVAEAMQADWPDGTFADYALVPKHSVTIIDGLDAITDVQLNTAIRYIVPFGGLQRGRLVAGETVIINGATGAYGYAAVMLALAMGAGCVIAAGRNKEKLKLYSAMADRRVVQVVLSGDVNEDVKELRKAAGGGAHLAFDIVGNAQSPDSTIAALKSLLRNGRMVLMGSMTSPLSISYSEMMFNNWEILGQFMYPVDSFLKLFNLIRGGLLSIDNIIPVVYPLSEFEAAMDKAANANPTECVVMKIT